MTAFSLRLFRAALVVGVLAALPAMGQVHADELRLQVNLQAVRDATGELRVSLYRETDTFRKEDRALKVVSIAAQKGDAQVVFSGLAPGRYAVMAYHDENSDGKLNLRFGMFPTEGYGLSNNPTVIGPPKFADSAVDLAELLTSITVRLSY